MSDQQDPRSPEEIEKEIHRSRERLDSTLSEIEERFSPQRLLNASYDYIRHGGANEFFANLGTTIKENPVPFLVTGAGLGWMLTAQQRGGPQHQGRSGHFANSEAYPHSGPSGRYDNRHNDNERYENDRYRSGSFSDSSANSGGARAAGLEAGGPLGTNDRPGPSAFSHPPAVEPGFHGESAGFGDGKDSNMRERMGEKAHHFGQSTSDAAHHFGQSASDAAHRLSDQAHHWGDSMRDSTSHFYQSTQHGMDDATQWAKNAGRHTSDFIQEHPLVAGALGFAIGAALGGILPSTRKEDAYMGEYRDRFMDEAAERGQQQADNMQHSLHERTEKMKDDTDKQKDEDQKHQEHDNQRTPSDTQGEHMRYSDEAMPGHNAASGLGGNPGKEKTPHEKDRNQNEHGLTDSDTPSGNTQGDDTLEPPKHRK